MAAVGDGIHSDKGGIVPLDVKLADKILFGKFSGTEVTIDSDELVIMNESDIMGIIS